MEYETCFVTMVGSHVWGANTPESDEDIFKCYIAPSRDFLIGIAHMGGHENQSAERDISSYEIGHVINQLKGGNLNHIIGVMSHLVMEDSPEYRDLKGITRENISRNCYKSIKGMSMHNYKKYFEDKPKKHMEAKKYQKKLNQVARVINFGINILEKGEIKFEKHEVKSRWDIQKMITDLDTALENSGLPDKPDDDAFDDFLYNLRLKRLGD